MCPYETNCKTELLKLNQFLIYWIRYERPTSAMFQVVKSMYLSCHFEFTDVYGIVPAFDIYAAFESASAQFGNDIRPVAVAKSRCTMEGELA